MAYNDYGAFVYKNGIRRTDCEDVPIFGDCDTELAPGARIYASLIRQYGGGEDGGRNAFEWPSRCHHGTMGDGRVRVGVYKTGLPMASVYVLSEDIDIPDGDTVGRSEETGDYVVDGANPFVLVIEGCDEIIRRSGQEPVGYPDDYDSDEGHEQYEAYSRQIYGPYRYEFDVCGHHLLFEAREHSNVVRPAYHARMECPDGDIWDVFYDGIYGAGHSDCRFGMTHRDPKFDEIDFAAVGEGDYEAWPVSRCLCLSVSESDGYDRRPVTEGRISVYDSVLAELATSLGIPAPEGDDGDGAWDAERRYTEDDMGAEHVLYRSMTDAMDAYEPISTFSSYAPDYMIPPEAAVDLINLGIDLARAGIDSVRGESLWWLRDGGHEVRYGLDGTPFEGFAYRLSPRWMVPSEVRHDKEHPLHDDKSEPGVVIDKVFSEYERTCGENDGERPIAENELGVELTWPIWDANHVAFSPLMLAGDEDGALEWQRARRVGDVGGEEFEVVGCGWNDEAPFVLAADGEMFDPSTLEIVIDNELGDDGDSTVADNNG